MVRCARQFGPNTPLPPEIAQHVDRLSTRKLEGAAKFAYILPDLSKQLASFDRYERRALSRRKFAIREFVALQRKIPRK